MNVAVICEYSGRVRDAFIRRGHHAVSYDLLDTEAPGPHVKGDVREADLSWADLVIAHPPCTYLCNSGVRWLHTEPGRWEKMREAAEFFRWCLSFPVVAVENPIMHGHAGIEPPTQIIQPWMFGTGETKATGLWLRGLPRLHVGGGLWSEDLVVAGRVGRVHSEPPGPDRWKRRSTTYQGIADAMADQWGTMKVER